MTAAAADASAERAVAMLAEMSADLRACAVVGADGAVLAASVEAPWGEQANALWAAADADGSGPATQVHVASEAGEVFVAREGGITAIALTERFALESLMFCDLRAALREIGAG